jgi:endonuclease/exonuclease/phosphatase family metal-dependent hydrolase
MRRHVHWLCGFLLWAAVCSSDAAARAAISITVVSANLSDNTSQAYTDPGIRLLQALDPDIVGIQEFNYKEGTSKDLVHRIFGPGYHFAREKGGARLPNGIISRYPIVAFGQWEDPYVGNRTFAWATIAIPGPRPLHVVSVHLVQNRAERRLPEARLLLKLIRKQFPEDDYVVLCGDLNVNTRESAALAELTRWFVDSHHPADQEGNKNTNAGRTRPYDFVLPNPALAKYHAPTVLAGKNFPDGLVFDTRLWNPPPPPAEWEDSSRDMQHMPVMKTYRIPLL